MHRVGERTRERERDRERERERERESEGKKGDEEETVRKTRTKLEEKCIFLSRVRMP